MHISVLQKEIINYLDPKPNENFIDATFGAGGHTLAILERNRPNGRVLGIETDPELYKEFQESEAPNLDRLILVNDSYVNLEEITKEYEFRPVNGILFDLGLSSWHLAESKRGFSFRRDEPLDMRYDPERNQLTAFEIINYKTPEEIEKILKEYGEEEFAKNITANISKQRKIKPIRTTSDLVGIISISVPPWYQRRKIHFATKSFQALRIAVNKELENLKNGLSSALRLSENGGRIAVISFHSLEDRIVKNFFKEQEKAKTLTIVTKKPVSPTEEEISSNPRCRSAKLRVARKST